MNPYARHSQAGTRTPGRRPGRVPSSRRSTRAARVFFLVLCAVVPPGCGALGLGGFNVISVEEEWALGRQIEAELNRELNLSNDAAVTGYVDRLGQQIVAQTRKAELPWRFHVVDEPEINAFNAPGGLVYVYSGLIAEAENVSELVAVLAHEVGHGVARHGTQRISQQYGIAVLAGVVLGQDPGVLAEIVASIVAAGAVARFSRQDEFEADELGVEYAARAGYHPQGMVTFFQRLMELQQREPGRVERMFATHPPTRDRIERSQAQIDGMNVQGLTVNDRELAQIQGRL
jgi:beta-barrel assembly-enhancing protease